MESPPNFLTREGVELNLKADKTVMKLVFGRGHVLRLEIVREVKCKTYQEGIGHGPQSSPIKVGHPSM